MSSSRETTNFDDLLSGDLFFVDDLVYRKTGSGTAELLSDVVIDEEENWDGQMVEKIAGN